MYNQLFFYCNLNSNHDREIVVKFNKFSFIIKNRKKIITDEKHEQSFSRMSGNESKECRYEFYFNNNKCNDHNKK